ncbi:unnamed protein product, partial [Staurois parvus]
WKGHFNLLNCVSCRNSVFSLVLGGRIISVFYVSRKSSAPSLVLTGGGIVPHHWCPWKE